MSFDALLIQTVTITPRSRDSEDEWGNREFVDGEPFDAPGRIEKITIGEAESSEAQDVEADDWLLFLPPDVVVDHHSAVAEGGRSFEVKSIEPILDALGVHHLEVILRLVQG